MKFKRHKSKFASLRITVAGIAEFYVTQTVLDILQGGFCIYERKKLSVELYLYLYDVYVVCRCTWAVKCYIVNLLMRFYCIVNMVTS
jgi:hypothetical protein